MNSIIKETGEKNQSPPTQRFYSEVFLNIENSANLPCISFLEGVDPIRG
jgi:hypothetical protein